MSPVEDPSEPVPSSGARAPLDGDAGASESFVPRDVNHVLVAGQSLGVGVSGVPVLSLTQPYANLMFNTGVMAGSEALETWVPLVEGDTIPGSKAVVETMSSAFANLVTQLSLSLSGDRASSDFSESADHPSSRHDLLLSVHASGAKPYRQLSRGTRAYNTGMAQVAAARDIAKKLGKSYVVRAIMSVHGESDHAEKSTRYEADLLEWQADYERDIAAITGQTDPVPMFETQMSSWTRMMRGTETSTIPGAQLAAHVDAPGRIILVGPKYHLSYAKDGVHLTSRGYWQMGEDYAKAYRRVILEKKRWEPLRPIAVTRDGAAITIKFLVPVPPLAIDTTLVSDPGNLGFEYSDASSTSPPIARVEVIDRDAVVVTLASVPTGNDRRIRYAFTGVRGARAGPTSGARGNLRDSDSTPSRAGHRLYNWCVHFDEPVP